MIGVLRAQWAAVLPVMLAMLVGCDPSDPCDSGYYEEHGACYMIRAPRDASTGEGGDEDGGAESDAAAAPSPEDLYAFFGDECADESDCPEALYCGAPQLPMCTQVNCLDDETLCPPDWLCTDISAFTPDPAITSVCLQ